MSRRTLSKPLLAHLLLFCVVAVWGATFPLVKAALSDASPLLFNLLRMTLATLALATFSLRQVRSLSPASRVYGMTAGFLLGAGYQLQTAGLDRTSPTKSAFITGLVVVFVALFSMVPALRPRNGPTPRWTVLLGATLAFAGLALLTTPPGSFLKQFTSGINVGDALTLLCAVAFAGHLLTLSRVAPGTPPGGLSTLQIACATVLMLFSLRASGPLHLQLTPRLLSALLITSLFATAAAFTIQSWAQQHLPATHTAALLTLEPIFALLTSKILFNEHLSRRMYAGTALIFAGILIIELLGQPMSSDPALALPSTSSPVSRD